MMTTMGIRKVTVVNEDAYRWAFGSLLCAALASVIAPVVFGPLGLAAGSVAVWKGGRWWGTAGFFGGVVAGVVGYALAAGLVA